MTDPLMSTFEARYPGTCPACGDGIRLGDPIADSDDGYVHEHCEGRLEEPTKPPCERCWLVHAGECM